MKPTDHIRNATDHKTALAIISRMLKEAGGNNLACSDERDVANTYANQRIEAILLDLVKPHISGEVLLLDIRI